MKTIDLSSCKVEDLSLEDSIAISGGTPWVAFSVTFVLLQILTNPKAHIDALVAGFNAGYEATKIE